MLNNQRLLISVFDAQETREAILGGARVIDCEDPAGALGDISPIKVMQIADAVLGYKRDLSLQISTNIGENQLLFRRDDAGRAVERFAGEIAGKAAQAALGVAAAMGTDIHPVNIVKVGLDGMSRDVAARTLQEVRETLDRSALFSRSQVIAVFFAQNLKLWEDRREQRAVTFELLMAREYSFDPGGDVDVFKMFTNGQELADLKQKLGGDTNLFHKTADGTIKPNQGARVRLTRLHSRKELDFSDDPRVYLAEVAKLTADAGADGLMLDTRIHSKVAKIVSLKDGLPDPDPKNPLSTEGIFTAGDLAEVARFCHGQKIEFWAAGSIQAKQAQILWALDKQTPGLIDGIAVRGGASAQPPAPPKIFAGVEGARGQAVATRGSRRIIRELVTAYDPRAAQEVSHGS